MEVSYSVLLKACVFRDVDYGPAGPSFVLHTTCPPRFRSEYRPHFAFIHNGSQQESRSPHGDCL